MEGRVATASEIFWTALPQLLVCGMPPEEFWHGDFRLARAYIEAYKVKSDNDKWDRWLQGLYTFNALKAAAPAFRELSKWKGERPKYPQEPIDLGAEAKEQAEDLRNRQKAERFKAQLHAWNETRRKKVSESGRGNNRPAENKD